MVLLPWRLSFLIHVPGLMSRPQNCAICGDPVASPAQGPILPSIQQAPLRRAWRAACAVVVSGGGRRAWDARGAARSRCVWPEAEAAPPAPVTGCGNLRRADLSGTVCTYPGTTDLGPDRLGTGTGRPDDPPLYHGWQRLNSPPASHASRHPAPPF